MTIIFCLVAIVVILATAATPLVAEL